MTATNSILCEYLLPENTVADTIVLNLCEHLRDWMGQTFWSDQHHSSRTYFSMRALSLKGSAGVRRRLIKMQAIMQPIHSPVITLQKCPIPHRPPVSPISLLSHTAKLTLVAHHSIPFSRASLRLPTLQSFITTTSPSQGGLVGFAQIGLSPFP